MKTSKLISCAAVGTSWDRNGETYYHQLVEFENGDKGQANSKTPKAKWEIGEEFTYDLKVNGNYTNITGIKPVGGFKPSGYTPRKLTWLEINRMAKSNGSAASWKLFGKRDEAFVNRVVSMITYQIPEGDVEFNSDNHSILISRMSATKNILEGRSTTWSQDSFLKECMAEVNFIQG